MKYDAAIQWRDAISLLLIGFGIILFSYWDTLYHLFKLWGNFDDGEYAHGWLIVAVVVYLVWDKRLILAKMQPKLDLRPVAIVPVLGFCWLVGVLVDINLVQTISVIMIMMLCVWFALGYRIAKELLFAMLFVFFATPAWLPLQAIFQTVTVHTVYQMLVIMGIPVFRDGYLLIIPEGSFAVLEACSGLRYFLVAFALSTLFSYLNFYRFKIKLLYVALFLIASLVANWLRVFIVIYAGHLTQMQHPYVHDHVNLGWYIFLVMVAGLYWVGFKYLSRWDTPSPKKEQRAKAKSERLAKIPMRVLAVMLVSMVLVAPPAISEYLKAHVQVLSHEVEMPAVDGWSAVTTPQGELLLPDYKKADLTLATSYQGQSANVQTAIAYYSSSRSGVSLIDHANRIVDREQWSILTAEKPYQLDNGYVKEVTVRSRSGQERVVWFWYRVGGMDATDKYVTKMFEAIGVLAGSPDGALIAISAGYDVDPGEARAALTSFYKEAKPDLDGFIDNLVRG